MKNIGRAVLFHYNFLSPCKSRDLWDSSSKSEDDKREKLKTVCVRLILF
jgi:hypothetical protein